MNTSSCYVKMATEESDKLSKNLTRAVCDENSSTSNLIDVLPGHLQDIDQNWNSLHLKKGRQIYGNQIMRTNNRSSTYIWCEFEGQVYDM